MFSAASVVTVACFLFHASHHVFGCSFAVFFFVMRDQPKEQKGTEENQGEPKGTKGTAGNHSHQPKETKPKGSKGIRGRQRRERGMGRLGDEGGGAGGSEERP